MRIYLNGESTQDLPQDLTVSALVQHLDLADKRIAVELDGVIIPRSEHNTTALCEGSRIEIVAAIGGG